MAHIALPEGLPGIVGLMKAYPKVAKHLNGLAEELLRGPSSLTPAQREIIATYVSWGNQCTFCTNTHAATARHLLGASSAELVDMVMHDLPYAVIGEKLRALLRIAEKVRLSGRRVTDSDIAVAKREGANDDEIHDTILIAAAFSMFNRYVDGAATTAPSEPEVYKSIGAKLATKGYINSID